MRNHKQKENKGRDRVEKVPEFLKEEWAIVGAEGTMKMFTDDLTKKNGTGVNSCQELRERSYNEEFKAAFEAALAQVIKWMRERKKKCRYEANLHEMLIEDEKRSEQGS